MKGFKITSVQNNEEATVYMSEYEVMDLVANFIITYGIDPSQILVEKIDEEY